MERRGNTTAWGMSSPATRQRASRPRCLPDNPIFTDLTEAELAELDRLSRARRYDKGAILYLPGETGEQLFLVMEGAVELYEESPKGRKLLLGRLGPGAVFGEMALLGHGMYDAVAETVEPSTICVLEREDLRRLLLQKPELALRLLELMGQRLRDAEERLTDLAFKDVTARLAIALLRLGAHSRNNVVVGWSHDDLAALIGSGREVVTARLDALEAAGVLKLGRRRIVLRDLTALEALAAGRAQDASPDQGNR